MHTLLVLHLHTNAILPDRRRAFLLTVSCVFRMCATVPQPVANNGLVIMVPCGTAANQLWNYSKDMFAASAPNASGAFMLPTHPDTPQGWGWTFSSGKTGPNSPFGEPLSLFDIGSRFTGECKGHHNCNFNPVNGQGQLTTFYKGQCVGTITKPPPPPPPPTPPPPTFNCTGLCFSPTHGDHMVLQHSPAAAAVYGLVGTSNTDAVGIAIQVTVTPAPSSSTSLLSVSAQAAPYTVTAAITAATPWSGGGKGWKALLKPTESGGNYTITAVCTAGCSRGSSSGKRASISDVTFGAVWYCAGQSNMALPLLHTFSRNLSMNAINAGKYSNVRIHGKKGNMNVDQNWTSVKGAVESGTFLSFSSTCYYFGESLSDALGAEAPPIGLVHTSVGGSMIEEWTLDATTAECRGATPSYEPQQLWNQNIVPYLDMSIEGWVWYQGENNCNGVMGNSAQKVGTVSCRFVFGPFLKFFLFFSPAWLLTCLQLRLGVFI